MTRSGHLGWLLLIGGLAAWTCSAQAPATNSTGEGGGIQFRRLLVPEELIPTRFPTYRPMRRETFAAEIGRINARASRAEQSTARILRATYRATLTGDGELSGDADLEVLRTVPEPTFLPLSPCNLALRNLRWEADPSASLPAGTLAGGELQALVDRDGTLQFSWSAPRTGTANGMRTYAVQFPRCAATRLEMELPMELVPRSDRGVFVARSSSPAATPAQIWTLELGGHTEFLLHIEPRPAEPATRPQPMLRESVRYRITSSGLELRATFRLSTPSSHLDRLFLRGSPGLHVASAQVGDRILSLARPEGTADADLVQVVLDEPLWGNDHELVVLAFAPLVVGEPWRLPSVRPTEVDWQEGQAIIEVVEPLLLAGLRMQHGIENSIEPLAAPEQGEARQVQFWQPDAFAEVELGYPEREIVADLGTSIRINELAATGRQVVDVQARRGTSFALHGLVAPGWTIDSVQSEPPEVFESFLTSGAVPRQELVIRLRHAIPQDRSWRLIVRAHRRTPRLDQPLRGDLVQIVRFPELQRNLGLVSLVADPPLRLTLSGDEHLQRIDPQTLVEDPGDLVTAAPNALLFHDARDPREWSVTVSREQPRFSTQINQMLEVDARELSESYEIRCEPSQSHVSRLLVLVSPADPTPWEWTLVDGGENRVSTRLVAGSENGFSGDAWEVTLSRPLNRAFLLRATRRRTVQPEAAVAFFSVPEASSQTGTLRVHALAGPLDIRTRNLQPMVTAAIDPSRLPTLRYAYRFAPSQEVAANVQRFPLPAPLSAAWIWQAVTDSRWDLSGSIEHESRLQIENTGASTLQVEIPEGAALSRVAVDHGVLSPAVSGRQVTIPLPKERRFPLVSVIYRTHQAPFRWGAAVQPAPLNFDLPCLHRETRVWIPPGFTVLGQSLAGAGEPTWDERLFGFRLWRRGAAPFDAFRAADWRTTWDTLVRWTTNAPEVERPAVSPSSSRALDELPWVGLAPSVGTEEAACGWLPFDFPQGSDRARLWIYRRGLVQAFASGLLLMVAGITASWTVVPVRTLTLIACGFAALALLVPIELTGIARGLFLGTLVGLVWRLGTRRVTTTVIVAAASRASSIVRHPAAGGVTAVVVLALWSGEAWVGAQVPTATAPDAAATTTFNVLSPIDEQQQEKGDYLYLPQSMYDMLQRRATESLTGAEQAWLEFAEHHVHLAANEPADARLLCREFATDFQLRAFQPAAEYRLRCRRDQVRVIELNLNGQSIPVEWDDAGTELLLTLPERGNHRVRLVTRPLQPAAEVAGTFSVPISRAARSRLVVHAPGATDRVIVPSAVGAISRTEGDAEVTTELYPADELAVRWTAPVAKLDAMPIDTDVAELLWLHVQANSLTVHGRFHFAARHGTLSQVTILVDRGLRLLPAGKDQPIASVDVVEGPQQRIRCWLDRPYDDVTLELSFAFSAVSPVGQWKFPRIEGQASRRASTWLGITATEGLQAELLTERPPTKLTPSAFLGAWDQVRDPPQQALVLPNEAVRPRLAIRPVASRITAQEHQDILVGMDRVALDYEGVVSIDSGRATQIRLLTPDGFEPRDILVLHDDANRLLRWARVSPQELTVFFNSPLSGQVRVHVRGELAVPRGNRRHLPLLAIADAGSPQRTANLYQEENVRIELLSPPGLLQTTPTDLRRDTGRFVGSLEWKVPQVAQPALELFVRPNRPRVTGSLVTQLTLQDERWRVRTTLLLEIESGTMDTVRMLFPPELSGPIFAEPGGTPRVQPATGETGRYVTVPLPEPDGRQVAVTLSADLAAEEGDRIRAPEIRVLDGIQLKRFLVLPMQLQRQKARWDTSGLQSTELPAELAAPAVPEDAAVYQVVGPRPQAVLREVEQLAGTPSVHLADYQVRWADDGQVRGVATFYLEPSRLAQIEVTMPEGVRPLHFQVAGLPALGQPVSGGQWRVPLGPELLPQLIEVLFAAEVAPDPEQLGSVTFAAPSIARLPVQHSLWTVQGPPAQLPGQTLLQHTATTAFKLDEIRWRTAQALLRRGLSDASQATPGDRDAWRQEWEGRIRQLEQRRARGAAIGPSGIGPAAVPADFASAWQKETPSLGPSVHATLRGDAPRIQIHYPHPTRQAWWHRVANLLVLLAACSGGAWAMQRNSVRAWWHRAPQLFVALLGLAWWLLCVPSILGLAILVVAAASALAPRGKSQPA